MHTALSLCLKFSHHFNIQFLGCFFTTLPATYPIPKEMEPQILWLIQYSKFQILRKSSKRSGKCRKCGVGDSTFDKSYLKVAAFHYFEIVARNLQFLIEMSERYRFFSTCEVKRITLVIDYKHLGLLQGISSSLQLKEHQKVL